jgi:hypothetical protein
MALSRREHALIHDEVRTSRIAIAVPVVLSLLILSMGAAPSPSFASTTALQCYKEYNAGPSYRRCLTRTKEPPGTSCTNPFWVETTGFDQKGYKQYLTVEVLGKNPNAPDGVPWHIHVEVKMRNPHIVICPRVELKVWVRSVEERERDTPGPGKLHTYFPLVTPELGTAAYTSGALTVPWGGYAALATARRRRA